MNTTKMISVTTLVSLLGATAGFAADVMPPAKAAGAKSAIVATTFMTLADAYDNGVGSAHFQVGTADGNPGAPNGLDCSGFNALCENAGGETIVRAGYVGSLCINCPGGPNANAMTTFAVFNLPDNLKGKDCGITLVNSQNFLGLAQQIGVKVMENRGDDLADFGAESLFRDRGPFGSMTPNGGGSPTNFITVMTDAHTNATTVPVPARSPSGLTSHPFGAGLGESYDTYDRSIHVHLGDISEAVALAKGKSYNTCRYSCTGIASPFGDNEGCDLAIVNPLYVSVYSLAAGHRSSAAAIQDGLADDNIGHLGGDCDFDGGLVPQDIANGGAAIVLECKN